MVKEKVTLVLVGLTIVVVITAGDIWSDFQELLVFWVAFFLLIEARNYLKLWRNSKLPTAELEVDRYRVTFHYRKGGKEGRVCYLSAQTRKDVYPVILDMYQEPTHLLGNLEEILFYNFPRSQATLHILDRDIQFRVWDIRGSFSAKQMPRSVVKVYFGLFDDEVEGQALSGYVFLFVTTPKPVWQLRPRKYTFKLPSLLPQFNPT